MSLICVISVVFLDFLKMVDAKTCIQTDSFRTFPCGMYEYCCGARCCRSPLITFYQMWYFWLMVFLTILFCSGGGWWYRLRNQDRYITPSMAQRITQTRPIIYPAHGATIIAAARPMAPSGMPMPPTGMHMPSAMPSAPYNVQYPVPPPPPYYGPPPSYDTVVNQNPNQQQNLLNQNRAPSQQN